MRKIAVVTVGRSDYGILLPILKKLKADHDIELLIIVAGMHLAPEFGLTYKNITDDGFEISDCVEMLLSSNTPHGVATSMGLGVIGFSQVYSRRQPDMLLLVGDRFEMHSAAAAAQPFNIPIAHIHGGEITEGAIDDSFRHSITKLSHIHFVSTEEYRSRVIRMGEEPWRVILSGAPSLDNLYELNCLTKQELGDILGISLNEGCLLVTYHPVTREYRDIAWQINELLDAISKVNLPVIFTKANADVHGNLINRMLGDFSSQSENWLLVDNLGTQRYFSLMSHASAMVGNTSSGIIEAPSVGVPVVNIGSRQEGRVRSDNIIDVGYTSKEILSGIEHALDAGFQARAQEKNNPYYFGGAADIIHEHLVEIPTDDRLIKKRFYDQNNWDTT